MQIECAKALVRLLRGRTASKTQVYKMYQLNIHMLKLWDKNVVDHWILVFEEVLGLLEMHQFEDEVTELIEIQCNE